MPPMGRPSPIRVVLQVLVIVLAAALGLWTLYKLERLVLLLILATFFAYLIAPLMRFAERPLWFTRPELHLPRPLAIGLLYLGIIGIAGLSAFILVPKLMGQIGDAVAQAPVYSASIGVWTRRWAGYYDRVQMPLELRQGIDRSIRGTGDAAVDYARGSLMTFAAGLSYLPWLALIPVLAFFFLKDVRQLRRAAIKMLPRRFRTRGRRLFDDLNATLAIYVRAQLLACLLVGGLCGAGFALLGVPYPALLAVTAGILEFIPLVGPLLCAVIATTVAAVHVPMLGIWVVVFLAILRIVQDYVIYPRLVGQRLHLHPLAVIVAVLAGLELAGTAGIFLAVPAAAVGSVVYHHWGTWRSASCT